MKTKVMYLVLMSAMAGLANGSMFSSGGELEVNAGRAKMQAAEVETLSEGVAAQTEDGVWTASSGNWDDAANWKDGVVAGNGGVACMQVDGPVTAFLRGDVALHGLFSVGQVGCNNSVRRDANNSTAVLRMTDNPFIMSAPVYTHYMRFSLLGTGLVASGDETPLTVQGGQFNLGEVGVGGYSFTGFPRVDLKDMYSITMLSVGGIADGDVRLLGTRLNFDYNHSELTTTNNLIGGKLIIGSGMNYSRMGYKGAIRYPAIVEREKNGVFSVMKSGGNSGYSLAAPVETYMNGRNRFPTWWLFADESENHFLTYNASEGFTNANFSAGIALSDAQPTDTVVLDSATALAGDATAAAVHVKSGDLDLAGHTLRLGNEDEPGLLILQNNNVNGANGSIVFEGADGIITANNPNSHVRAKITGASGVSVVAGVEMSTRNVYFDNPGNTFSGGLDLLIGTLCVTNAGSLGTGRVRVHGYPINFDYGRKNFYGGSATLNVGACAVTNSLVLAGMGAGGGASAEATEGHVLSSLYLNKGASVRGDITLENDTAIRSAANSGTVEISGAISGAHDLCLTPSLNSEIRISNELDDEVSVQINGFFTNRLGAVSLAGTGSLGVKDIRNNGTFAIETSRTFPNAIAGIGSYKQTNDIDVVFAKSVKLLGGALVGDGSVTLKAGENTLGSLAGSGDVHPEAGSTLTLGGAGDGHDAFYCGEISVANGGALTLVKNGGNTQIFSKPMSFDGEVVVNAGTLKLGGIGAAMPRTSVPAQVHVDASDAGNVQTNAVGLVHKWLNNGSADGDLIQGEDSMKPAYDAAAMNGRGGVVFNGSNNKVEPYVTNRLFLASGGENKRASFKHAFMSFSVRTQTMFGAPIGDLGKDAGVRLGYTDYLYNPNGGTFVIDRTFTRSSDAYLLNGVKTLNGECHRNYVLEQRMGSTLDWCVALGHYFEEGANRPRAFNGAIGEVALFAEPLNAQEEFTVRAYFNEKWGVGSIGNATDNILPPGSSLTVKSGATVDFAGVNQRLERLENYGVITNSSATPVVVTVGNAVLSGKIAGNVKVVVDGGRAVVKNWRNMVELPVDGGLAFHLDGADLSTLQRNDLGQVTNWLDRSGNDMNFKDDVDGLAHKGATLPPPVFDAALYGGRGGVKFTANRTDADGANRLTLGAGKHCELRTVFIVTQTDAWTYFGGLLGPRNGDDCLRLGSATDNYSWSPYGRFNANQFHVNGALGKSFTRGVPYVITAAVSADKVTDYEWSLGQYFKVEVANTSAANFATVGGLRGYCGSVAEVVAYNRDLSDGERVAVTEYLTAKWLDASANIGDEVFGDEAGIGLANGGTVDLGGIAQTVNGISGNGGTIANGNVTIGGVMEVAVDAGGDVMPYQLGGATLADGLKIVLTGDPSSSRVVIARGVARANVGTFVAPSRRWKVSLASNGDLVLLKGGTAIVIR